MKFEITHKKNLRLGGFFYEVSLTVNMIVKFLIIIDVKCYTLIVNIGFKAFLDNFLVTLPVNK